MLILGAERYIRDKKYVNGMRGEGERERERERESTSEVFSRHKYVFLE